LLFSNRGAREIAGAAALPGSDVDRSGSGAALGQIRSRKTGMNNTLRFLILAMTAAGLLSACGSGSGTANSTAAPAAAAGVATPKAVSVVTAN
jgi:hypothetical protein